uniref:Uncharacterized protein n=1 Tax=Trichobilharzia regenti TaxID=157069 RepID=A0AA85JM18_TRIRE|nr:unnamed protein product [Trichobilharzia regenti]
MTRNHHTDLYKSHKSLLLLLILLYITICTLGNIVSTSASPTEDASFAIDFPCGPHPIDMFLSKLFDYLEKQETNFESSNDLEEKLRIKMIYAKLLYAFTPMPNSSYFVYNEIMLSINEWNECMSKQMRHKKWLKRARHLQNVNTIIPYKEKMSQSKFNL